MRETVISRTSAGDVEIIIDKGIDTGAEILKKHKPCHVLIVSDDSVYALYGEKTKESIEAAGFVVDTFVFPHGEESKNIDTLNSILEYAASKEMSRTDLFVALGGGVVGDITGFASAVFLRGVDYVQVPTTVLAAVDSSVGGKTAVDLNAGKNLIGAFHQPLEVLLDVDVFDTLPEEIFTEGLAEAIKYGMIKDKKLYDLFKDNDIDSLDMIPVCKRCIEIKADVVEKDEFDNGERRLLNFGHTPGHAVEILSKFGISHGHAVSIGMVIMTRLSERTGEIPQGSTDEFIEVLKKYNLPTECGYNNKELTAHSKVDKKRKGSKIGLVMLHSIGKAYVKETDVDDIERLYAIGLNM
jgi:3-dehydroquinate synthase